MADSGSLRDLSKELRAFADGLSAAESRKVVTAVAQACVPDVEAAVRADLGDLSFSNWNRGRPLQMGGKVLVLRDNRAIVVRDREGAGPLRVLDTGRHMGGTSGFAGPGVNAKTGMTRRRKDGGIVKVRARGARRRWNGYTTGHGTWDDASARIGRTAAKAFEVEIAKAVVRGLGRG